MTSCTGEVGRDARAVAVVPADDQLGHHLVAGLVMEFGLHLPNAGPFANGPDILRVAWEAEELGFHSVWLFDHLFTPTNLESKYPYTPDGSYPMLPEFPFYDPVAVIVGGHGDAALRRAARWGDGWAVSASGAMLYEDPVAAIQERLDTLARYCEEEGRSLDDLLLVGQASLGEELESLRRQAELGIDVCDLVTFAPNDQVLDDARHFMEEVAPALA